MLVTPLPAALMDNGCSGRNNPIHWEFDWTDCLESTAYHLHVQSATASVAIVDDSTLTTSSYVLNLPDSYITSAYLLDWRWRARAFVNGEWGEWTAERSFDVEALDTDCPPITPTRRTTWGQLKFWYR
ncbi:MAG: hypothetical protein ACRENS_03935 [Candidatus Eiseniibacteriota bacterium]